MVKMGNRYAASPSEVKSDYFQWLCGIVHADDPDCSFYSLMRALFEHEFRWSVDNDGNRAIDGEGLRDDFSDQSLYLDYSSIGGPCTVLEMLIALAMRIDDEIMWQPTESRTIVWFWEMIGNLGIDEYDDEHWEEPTSRNMVDYILDRWLDRRFRMDGIGGIFPMREADEDQRDVEIWYQMNLYFLEKYGIEEDLT